MIYFLKSIYFTPRAFFIAGFAAVLFCFSLLSDVTLTIGLLLLVLLAIGLLGETILLYSKAQPLTLERQVPKVLSNGDENEITLQYRNNTSQILHLTIYEDLPDQLQLFTWKKELKISPRATSNFIYNITPTERGEYVWYNNFVLLKANLLKLVARKIVFDQHNVVPCFPSFQQFKKLKISALVSNHSQMDGTHVRKLGQSMEFEQIKNYTVGDDIRHLNWKASAKQGKLMLNQFQDEKSQEIYCVIDMGRSMLQPFDQKTLLDYAVNASLGLTRAVIEMKDKAGLLNFYNDHCSLLKPKSGNLQFRKVNEVLYNINGVELDSSYELLYKFSRNQLKQRSLMVLFANFDNAEAVKRNLPYMKAMAKYHLLLLVIFKNTELQKYVNEPAKNTEEIYSKTIAQSMLNEQEILARELNTYGIITVICEPHNLSISVINKYLQIKRRLMI